MAKSWTQILRKINDYQWEIPQDYKPGMRVPGLVYADEEMLRHITEEQVLEQVANVATLPGIVRYSMGMPDIHWGYGFPVGGVAAMRLDDGVISPGGVGYDINCLPGDAKVLHEFGYHRRIADFYDCWFSERIKCVNPHTEVRDTEILMFLKQSKPTSPVLKLVTESGREILATADHPLLTPDGMVAVKDLSVGQLVSIYPFEGTLYEAPPDDVLVTEGDVRRAYLGTLNGLAQVLKVLHGKGLLPLRMNHPKLPYLVKLLGFVQGDGTLYFSQRSGSGLSFYADPEDLEAIRQDIRALSFIPSRIYRGRRAHRIQTPYGRAEFERDETFIHVRSTALCVLLRCLGATVGEKAEQDFVMPEWLDRAPRWMKRLYLAALFGAELSSPQTVTGHPYNFYAPVLSLNKHRNAVASGRQYLKKIQAWLSDFGVDSALLREDYVNEKGRASVRLRLQISSRPENLIRLWSVIGFEYNRRKQYLACVAAQYLRLKTLVLHERESSIEAARTLRTTGLNLQEITRAIGSHHVNLRFVERSVWEQRKSGIRIGASFPDFWTFLQEATHGLGQTGQVWDKIIHKQEISFEGPVYDFTVRDPAHTFIANSFVVSNCGVRLIRTDLKEEDVRPRLEVLVRELFENVPSGVGSEGKVRVDMREINTVLAKGAKWAVEKGYGWPEDLEVIEANGSLPAADPEKVSQQAKQRGKAQIGTLGSGNHFLEVQVVDQIYDWDAARTLGLHEPGQIVVFIHCGSRGLGHQVCTDYLRVAERALGKYGIQLPDRQLACVPIKSPEGEDYFAAMCAAANFAWANRQMITHWVRESFTSVFGRTPQDLGLALVYDVAHNIAKIEEYDVEGRRIKLCVHRKGATRAFPPGHPEVPAKYRDIGQPVLIPGDMGRYSYVAVGTQAAVEQAFGSTCHGAGRMMGRQAAKRALRGVDVAAEMGKRGILVMAQDPHLLAEEASIAYKDVADVVEVCHKAGISRRVARTRPIGVVKG